jgi:hypothetical protein
MKKAVRTALCQSLIVFSVPGGSTTHRFSREVESPLAAFSAVLMRMQWIRSEPAGSRRRF